MTRTGTIVEQEYQKRLRDHGITIRPDIIIHVPTATGGNRRLHNSTAFELKLRANAAAARNAFYSLDLMFATLDYPVGVFINIDSTETHATEYSGPYVQRMHFFAVRLLAEKVDIRLARFTTRGAEEVRVA